MSKTKIRPNPSSLPPEKGRSISLSFCAHHQLVQLVLDEAILPLGVKNFFELCDVMEEFRNFLQTRVSVPPHLKLH